MIFFSPSILLNCSLLFFIIVLIQGGMDSKYEEKFSALSAFSALCWIAATTSLCLCLCLHHAVIKSISSTAQ